MEYLNAYEFYIINFLTFIGLFQQNTAPILDLKTNKQTKWL